MHRDNWNASDAGAHFRREIFRRRPENVLAQRFAPCGSRARKSQGEQGEAEQSLAAEDSSPRAMRQPISVSVSLTASSFCQATRPVKGTEATQGQAPTRALAMNSAEGVSLPGRAGMTRPGGDRRVRKGE